jgi:mannobiose 2-epimerase
MRTCTASIALLLLLFAPSCSDREETGQKLHQIREEIQTELLTNILPFWALYSPDPAGGFHGTLRNDGRPVPDAPKGLVLNARILWTFSAAWRAFEVENYKQLADRAQRYLIDYFIDPEYGGAYWLLNADGIPLDTNKQTYGIAFAVYALSEHYRATGNKESLEQAIALRNALHRLAYDAVNGGYVDSFTRDWQLPDRFGYDGQGLAPKTMNTHLHILEAFTNLCRVWPDKQLKKQLTHLIHLFFDEIISPETLHQRLFFTMEWNSLDEIDSYGHDIELSWLLCEAAEVTEDEQLIERARQTAVALTDVQIEEGWSPLGYLYYEKSGGVLSKNIEWWPQAETVVALINAWQISGNPEYVATALTTWRWIKENLTDSEHGEWYCRLDENFLPITSLPKADMWKCPYHNSRMAFETIERIR